MRRATAFPMPPCGSTQAQRTAFVMAKIMLRFPNGPKCQDLVDAFGMSRATAFRYLAAIREARAAA